MMSGQDKAFLAALPAALRLAAGCMVALFLFTGLALTNINGQAQAAGPAYEDTSYPPPADDGYPPPEATTAVPAATATPTPAVTVSGTPRTRTPTVTRTVSTLATSPNLFLTEDALINESRLTPANSQTVYPTTTLTTTRTITITPVTPTYAPTATPTPSAENQGIGGFTWLVTGAGFVMPFVLLAFGFLAIAVARVARQNP